MKKLTLFAIVFLQCFFAIAQNGSKDLYFMNQGSDKGFEGDFTSVSKVAMQKFDFGQSSGLEDCILVGLEAINNTNYPNGPQTFNSVSCKKLVRLRASDGVITTFLPEDFNFPVYEIKVLSDNKILVGGFFTTLGTTTVGKISKLNADGSRDTSFNAGGFGFTGGDVYVIEVQSDGKILVGGSFTTYNGATCNKNIVRLNADGSLDTSFVPSGIGFADGSVRAIAIQSDGKILVGGSLTNYGDTTYGTIRINGITRLTANGAFDITDGGYGTSNNTNSASCNATTASGNGTVNVIKILPGDKVMLGGNFTKFNNIATNGIVVLGSNGRNNAIYTTQTNLTSVNDILVTGTSFIACGRSNFYAATNDRGITKFDLNITNGTIIYIPAFTTQTQTAFNTFNLNGSSAISSMALQSDGKIVTGGRYFSSTHTYINTIYNINRINNDYVLATNQNEFVKDKISIYPNPVKDVLNIQLALGTTIESYEIYDMLGKKVLAKNTTNSTLNVSQLNNGIYLLKTTTSNGVATSKFVKE